ncbi:hypothetical protein [Micromonospora tarapacensis]|nr:hypothetical protein [Micromonospora tarapacensis]
MSTVAVNGVVAATATDLWRVLTDLPRRASGGGPVEVLTPGECAP